MSSGPDPDARPRPRQRTGPDGGLRDLIGAGPSQLSRSKALRGRDVNQPTEDELADAEQALVIVRRDWRAPDPAK
ncbi:MAG TPA: hypothetical protein VK816_04510 [Jatrophihabitantaceae bacterium]|nr:hypothetical protein [Jatrophihabitantaceae bacterium]